MIVMMGCGVTVVHCKHSGTTSIISLGQHCGKGCKPTSKCMEISVLKCSTMAQAQVQSLEHHLPVSILPWLIKPLYELINFSLLTNSEALGDIGIHRHGPPREYLNLICVLLI